MQKCGLFFRSIFVPTPCGIFPEEDDARGACIVYYQAQSPVQKREWRETFQPLFRGVTRYERSDVTSAVGPEDALEIPGPDFPAIFRTVQQLEITQCQLGDVRGRTPRKCALLLSQFFEQATPQEMHVDTRAETRISPCGSFVQKRVRHSLATLKGPTFTGGSESVTPL